MEDLEWELNWFREQEARALGLEAGVGEEVEPPLALEWPAAPDQLLELEPAAAAAVVAPEPEPEAGPEEEEEAEAEANGGVPGFNLRVSKILRNKKRRDKLMVLVEIEGEEAARWVPFLEVADQEEPVGEWLRGLGKVSRSRLVRNYSFLGELYQRMGKE